MLGSDRNLECLVVIVPKDLLLVVIVPAVVWASSDRASINLGYLHSKSIGQKLKENNFDRAKFSVELKLAFGTIEVVK